MSENSSWIEVPIDQEIASVPEEGYAPFNFSDEGDYLLFKFTNTSFLKVFSALINGAMLTYPDTWLQVVWDFLENVEYPVSLCDQIANAILTCEDVQLAIATLIATPGPVQDAITNLVITDPDVSDYITNVFERLSEGQIAGKIAGGNCDESVVAGRAIAIVERLDTNNIDALEILEVGTNDEERLSQILSAFPGFGLLPLDELLDFAQDVLEDFNENYAAASTFDRKDAMAEEIYCLMRQNEDCSITWLQLFDFVKSKIPSAPFDIAVTIGDIIQFVADGDFNNDDLIFYGMMYLQLGTITASQNFNGLTVPLLSAITRDALPSSRWEDWDLCGPSPVIIFEADYVTWTGAPMTFIENPTPTSSTWELTFQTASGSTAVSVHAALGATGDIICCKIVETTGVSSYQHLLCGGSLVTGSGGGDSTTREYINFGFNGSAAGDVMRITVELL